MLWTLGSFYACGLIAWGVHAISHRAVGSQSVPIIRCLDPALCRIVAPLHWAHVPHHHPDPAVSGGAAANALEFLTTAFAACAYQLALALALPAIMHPGAAVAFFVSYTTVHLYNFHYGWNDVHTLHHLDPATNFSPNPFDLFFGTSDCVEDVWHQVSNVVLGCAVALFLPRALFLSRV